MPRYKLTIAYDGTDFCGWQKQFPHEDSVPSELRHFRDDDPPPARPIPLTADPEAATPEPDSSPQDRPRIELRTVQSVVERAVRLVVREPIILMGASRTDSGVHARGQVGAFTTGERSQSGQPPSQPDDSNESRASGWPASRGTDGLLKAINARLPRDVLLTGAEVAPPDFDPIGHAVAKRYTYTIWNGHTRPLWERRTAMHIWHPLDPAAMQQAAAAFVGEHDFAAFAAAGHGRLTTVRTVFRCDVQTADAAAIPNNNAPHDLGGQRIVISIEGNGFLWNMCRIIAGTLVEAGKGKLDADQVRMALGTGDRRLAGPTLPPTGLCLEWIRYA